MNHNFKLLKPTPTEVLVYIVVSITVLIFSNLTSIANSLLDPEVVESSFISFDKYKDAYLLTLDKLKVTAGAALAVFWAAFGIGLYIVGFTLYEVYIETRNDLVEASDALGHPKYFDRRSWLRQAVIRLLIRLSALVGLILLAILSLTSIYPITTQMMHEVVRVADNPELLLLPIAGVLIFAITIHLFIVLIRVLLLRTAIPEN